MDIFCSPFRSKPRRAPARAGFIITGMHIVVAPDSFKGTASAPEAAASIAMGVRRALPDATVTTLPMADGGEGTAAVLAQAAAAGGQSAETITLPTTDANGRLTQASYVLAGTTAFIDAASATGLPAVQDSLDPLHADSYGTGVLIADAETRGATSIVLGLGGTASVTPGWASSPHSAPPHTTPAAMPSLRAALP